MSGMSEVAAREDLRVGVAAEQLDRLFDRVGPPYSNAAGIMRRRSQRPGPP